MRIILGVTGCIAAYKAAIVLRMLQQKGHEIFPVMTRSATRFLAPLTLEKLSGNRVVTDLFEDPSPAIEHIALARRSDLLLVAPATAHTIARFAHGLADDFLGTLYVSTTTPVVLAPAMNVEMWEHAATRANLQLLEARGVAIVTPESGYLACGEVGAGRLANPKRIVEAVEGLNREGSLQGVAVLVSAGPTIEDIDPVRFLSNRSSGKMGYALAREAARRGGQVTLVSGPTGLPAPGGVRLLPVRSAREMAAVVLDHSPGCRVVVMAAAVSDFTPRKPCSRKLKKEESARNLPLERTVDILEELGKRKTDQLLVGFAAESGDLEARALEKLRRKNLDLVVANDISVPGQVFGSDETQVVILDAGGLRLASPRCSKEQISSLIWDRIEACLSAPAPSRTEG